MIHKSEEINPYLLKTLNQIQKIKSLNVYINGQTGL